MLLVITFPFPAEGRTGGYIHITVSNPAENVQFTTNLHMRLSPLGESNFCFFPALKL